MVNFTQIVQQLTVPLLSIFSSNNSLASFNTFASTSLMQLQIPVPTIVHDYQTYFPAETSMDSCQWNYHLTYTTTFNTLVDTRVSKFLKSHRAPTCLSVTEEPSGIPNGCDWWNHPGRCTEQFVVSVGDSISSLAARLGKQGKRIASAVFRMLANGHSAYEGLEYNFHQHCYDVEGEDYDQGPALSGADMLQVYLSFEVDAALHSAIVTTNAADFIDVGGLVSFPKTINAWQKIVTMRLQAYCNAQLLGLLRSTLRYIYPTSSTEKKQQQHTTNTSNVYKHITDSCAISSIKVSVEIMTKQISARYSQVQNLLQTSLEDVLGATELVLQESQCPINELVGYINNLLWGNRGAADTVGFLGGWFKSSANYIGTLNRVDPSNSSAHIGQGEWFPTRALNESAMNQTKLIMLDENQSATDEIFTPVFLENPVRRSSARVWQDCGRLSSSVNESTAMDQTELILSGKNRRAIDESRASLSEKVRFSSTTAARFEGVVWVLVWANVAIILAVLGIVFVSASRSSMGGCPGHNPMELGAYRKLVLRQSEENPLELTLLDRYILVDLFKETCPEKFDGSYWYSDTYLSMLEDYQRNPSLLTSLGRALLEVLINKSVLYTTGRDIDTNHY